MGELFRRTQLRRRQLRQKGKPLNSFTELKNGELVVHLAHGIGRYRGMELLEKEGYLEEHLVVEFHGHTRIYVPATRIDLVQKYIRGRKVRPHLLESSGKTWQKRRRSGGDGGSGYGRRVSRTAGHTYGKTWDHFSVGLGLAERI